MSALNRFIDREGSTRAVSLMRIGLAALLWSEYGRFYRGHIDLNTSRILLGLAFYPLSAMMFIGFWSRTSTFLTGTVLVASYYILGYQGYRTDFVHHHTYAMNVLVIILALTPCGYSYSVDRWLKIHNAIRRKAELPKEVGYLWAVKLICFQVSAIYLGGTYDKLHWHFLDGSRLQQILSYYFGSHEGVSIPFFFELATLLAWVTVALEFFLGVGMYIPRFQKYLIPAGILFHAGIYWSMPVSTFSLMMMLSYLCFIPPEQVDRFLRTIDGSTETIA